MANTFAGAVEYRWSNGTIVSQQSTSIAVVPTGNQCIQNIQSVGTAAEAIVVGDVVPGFIYFKNLDSTNYVDFGIENTAVTPVVLRLAAGQAALIPTNNASWWAKANTAGCDVLVIANDA